MSGGIYRVRLREAVEETHQNEATRGGATSSNKIHEMEVELEAPAVGPGSVGLTQLVALAREQLRIDEAEDSA